MTATNSVAPRTDNVSAGTSTFAMIVLEKQLSKIYREIDMVTTPTGFPCAMSHANNGTSDLNAWVSLFEEFAQLMGYQTDTGELFSKLYTNSLNGDPDCGGLLAYGYYSGENVTYCLLCTAYTVVNIPLNTIVPRLTSDVHERDILVSTRMICAMIGTAIVMTITAPMVKFFGKGNEARGYLVTMTIYGIAAMLIFFVTFASTEEVVPPTVSNEKTTLLESLKGLTGQAWILFLLNLSYFSLYVVRNTTVLYYFKYNLGRTEWLSLVGILGILSGLPMLLALPALGKKIQQAKPDVCKCGTVHSGRPDDLPWKKFRSFSPCRTGDHRTWDLWNLWHYFCHAARCDRLFRIQEKFQRSGTDRCIPGIFCKRRHGTYQFCDRCFS